MKVSETKTSAPLSIGKLHEFFSGKKDVELAYLFGSSAKEGRGELSDIDIGVYLSNSLPKKERILIHLELIAGLTTLFKSNRIDLVIMNYASPVMNFEIIRPNKPIFVKDPDLKLDVEQRIMSHYLDRKFHEDRLNKAAIKRAINRESLRLSSNRQKQFRR